MSGTYTYNTNGTRSLADDIISVTYPGNAGGEVTDKIADVLNDLHVPDFIDRYTSTPEMARFLVRVAREPELWWRPKTLGEKMAQVAQDGAAAGISPRDIRRVQASILKDEFKSDLTGARIFLSPVGRDRLTPAEIFAFALADAAYDVDTMQAVCGGLEPDTPQACADMQEMAQELETLINPWFRPTEPGEEGEPVHLVSDEPTGKIYSGEMKRRSDVRIAEFYRALNAAEALMTDVLPEEQPPFSVFQNLARAFHAYNLATVVSSAEDDAMWDYLITLVNETMPEDVK